MATRRSNSRGKSRPRLPNGGTFFQYCIGIACIIGTLTWAYKSERLGGISITPSGIIISPLAPAPSNTPSQNDIDARRSKFQKNGDAFRGQPDTGAEGIENFAGKYSYKGFVYTINQHRDVLQLTEQATNGVIMSFGQGNVVGSEANLMVTNIFGGSASVGLVKSGPNLVMRVNGDTLMLTRQ